MKLTSSLFSKESLVKKINKRNLQRIQDHTRVSSAFKEEDSKLIKDNLDSIARYAERKNINLEFEPSASSKGVAKMNVYNRGTTLMNTFDDMDSKRMIAIPVTKLAGSAKLSAEISNKEELMEAIKSNSAQILYNKH